MQKRNADVSCKRESAPKKVHLGQELREQNRPERSEPSAGHRLTGQSADSY